MNMSLVNCSIVLVVMGMLAVMIDGSPEISMNLYQIIPELRCKSKQIKAQLDENKILLDYFYHWKPPGELRITFEEVKTENVDYGNYISPLDSLYTPHAEYFAFFPLNEKFVKEWYTLILDGIDKEGYETSHAVWVNIPFDKNDYEKVKLKSGKEAFKFKLDTKSAGDLVKFVGPRPLQGTGVYRYVFILFRQPHGWFPRQRLKFRENWGSYHKDHHGVATWANFYELQPIGVNFFTSSNEDLF